jgi:BspA type Leucine rich repeat region (6 copies)
MRLHVRKYMQTNLKGARMVKLLLIVGAVFAVVSANADVCDRSKVVISTLEARTNKKCADITVAMVSGIQRVIFEVVSNDEGFFSFQPNDFDGFDSLTHITLIIPPNLKALPSLSFDSLTKLEKILFASRYGGGPQSIPEDYFKGFSSLKIIDFHRIPFTTLPENLFQGLSNLNEIRILFGNDKLSSLPENLFRGLTSLKSLFLGTSAKSIFLPDRLFEDLVALQSIGVSAPLNGNRNFLPMDLLKNKPNLERALIFVSGLEVISDDFFKDTPKLTKLDLELPRKEVSPVLLSGLSNLKSLTLYMLSQSLPSGLFSGLDKVEQLVLRADGVSGFPDDFFKPLSSLRVLKLNGFNFPSLSKNTLAGLSSEFLSSLWITRSHIATIEEDAFASLENLDRVFIAGNDFTSLPDGLFKNNGKLKVAALGSNKLSKTEEEKLRNQWPNIKFLFNVDGYEW